MGVAALRFSQYLERLTRCFERKALALGIATASRLEIGWVAQREKRIAVVMSAPEPMSIDIESYCRLTVLDLPKYCLWVRLGVK